MAVLGGLVLIPVLVIAVLSRWGALIVVGLVVLGGLWGWVRQRRIAFIEVAAFLIHFDGVGAGPVRMGRIVAAVAVVVLIHKLLSGWRPPAIPPRSWIPVWALTVWGVLSGAWSSAAGSWMMAIAVYGLGVVFFCITALLCDSWEMLQRFFRAFWVGGLFGSAAGILALFLGTRSVGFGGDPNYFGLLQAAMIPLTVYYRRQSTDARTRLLYSIALLVVLAGAAGAGSRSGLIGGSIAIVATMVTRPGIDAARRVGVAFGSVILAGCAFVVGFVANPANLQRGFSDRGAGRLDLWNVTIAAIERQPFIGYGFGQVKQVIVPSLLTTPGSQLLDETRTEVSAHNTWLDVTGDLGLVGLSLFVLVFVVALVGLAWPRWRAARQLSTTLFVMMLPVLSGSFFLPLLNNKLAWSLIGASAVLQVPSWGARWSGLAGSPTDGPPGTALVPTDTARPVRVAGDGASTQMVPAAVTGPQIRLARWDLRVSRRFRVWIAVGAILGGLSAGTVAAMMPVEYEASVGVFLPRLDGPEGQTTISVDRERLQGVLTTAISLGYAAELKELSGVDLTVPEIRKRMSVTRPEMSAVVMLHFTDTDAAHTEAVRPHLVPALDETFRKAHEAARAQTANELRPVVPGEQRFYSGEFYLRTGGEAVTEEQAPRTAWMTLIGVMAGGLVAAGLALSQQRLPRVNNDDDFVRVLGLPVWTHLGRGRRRGASPGQFAQISAMVADHGTSSDVGHPQRFVVVSPRRDSSGPTVALGLAASLAAEGRRVVLVDAQMDRPALSFRLGRPRSRGLADVAVSNDDIGSVVRPVPPRLLPRGVRRSTWRPGGALRFVPAGRRRVAASATVPLDVLDRFDPDVAVVVLAPPVLGAIPVSALLGWGSAVVLALVEGRTVTFDAEDAAAVVRTFSSGVDGVVLLDV